MKQEKPLRALEEQQETGGGNVAPEEKQKKLDDLIEKFHRDSPVKTPPKTYRGVY